MHHFYILNGHDVEPIDDAKEWARLFGWDNPNRRVALTTFFGVQVSTMFLGLNHQWGEGPPLVFETMVFGGLLDQECERYSTWEEAARGHDAMVQRVKDASHEN